MRTTSFLLFAACTAPELAVDRPLDTLSGSATWQWTFDDGSSCTYTRQVDGSEDRSAPWLAPDGELFRVAVTMEGDRCARRVGIDAASALEHHGLSAEGWRRGGVDEPLHLQALADDATGWQSSYVSGEVEVPEGLARFEVHADFVRGSGRGDPLHGYTPAAAPSCGWSLDQVPPYRGDHRLVVGGEVPDALLDDACGETVRLHSLTGRYLVVDLAAMDCGPCQAMASGEPAFRASLAEDGVLVDTVTLLAPSLSAPWDAASEAERAEWAEAFGLHGPVLGDRSWGAVVVGEAVGGLAYPSWVLVAPDRTVIEVGAGFSGWDAIAERIREHHAGGR